MRSTTFVGADRQLNTQHMVFEKDYIFKKDEDYDETMREKPKGIKVVLKKRGLWKDRLLLEYKTCKGKEFSNNNSWETVPRALDSVDVIKIRRFVQKS
ncbi:15527_t:CDS:2 [Cetraspora pellucida]|uniref:15527_t:CDS:1 n=1 Tax=Cetraspora pellucida TaxID=1433469 RepID=A0ACA9N0R1_9GLOM|nr:15527_t:CDS:2 [Cetraspora pellucida]